MQREHVAQPVAEQIEAHAEILSPPGLECRGEAADLKQTHCWILRRGSRTSRSPSPSRLRPITVIISAMPGMVMIHGASIMYWRPSAMMLPQVGVGGTAPRPRKLKVASDSTA